MITATVLAIAVVAVAYMIRNVRRPRLSNNYRPGEAPTYQAEFRHNLITH